MTVERRRHVVRRLRALLSMTVERGASEAEAETAARHAAALMAEHGLAYASVDEIDRETFETHARPWFRPRGEGRRRAGRKPVTRYCLPGLSDLCSVEHFWDTGSGELAFFGRPHDVEAAHYLLDIVAGAIDRSVAAYKAAGNRRAAVFAKAMAARINQRLHAVARETRSANELRRAVWRANNGGRDLVTAQHEARRRAFAEAHATRRAAARWTLRADDVAAARAGLRAGDAVAFSSGVRADNTRRIEDNSDE